ncbi:MAG: ZIP family metal transporter [Terriglobales bacterium]
MKAALIASLLAGLATGLGGVMIALLPRISRRLYDTLLGFSAGVMLAAGSITLLWPALSQKGIVPAALGLLCGALLVYLLELAVPHLEPHFAPQLTGKSKSLGLLMAAALTLHHVPEGLAIGVAFGGGTKGMGLIVAIAIALQNIPEGLAVAMPLRAAGFSRPKAIAWASLSGLTEPLAAAVGVWFAGKLDGMMPFGMALAAGAMIFVASDQLIPESHAQSDSKSPSLGLISGFVLLAVLTRIAF